MCWTVTEVLDFFFFFFLILERNMQTIACLSVSNLLRQNKIPPPSFMGWLLVSFILPRCGVRLSLGQSCGILKILNVKHFSARFPPTLAVSGELICPLIACVIQSS